MRDSSRISLIVARKEPTAICSTAFVLQRKAADQWADIPGTKTDRNADADFGKRFDSIASDVFRLLITESPESRARIWEIELYDIP